MEYSKLYQYKDVTKVSSFNYSGNLAIKTKEDNQYDVSSPVNTAENYSINEDVIVINNTLNNEESMKFNFNFKVNKSAINIGTRNILDFPGLLSVKSENNTLWFKFYYEDAPTWKYVSASELIDGWNNVALVGDGVKVKLTVNSTVHTVLDSSLTKTITVYSGFSSSNSIVLAQGFPQVNSCDIIVRATSNDVSSTGVLLAKYQSSEQYFSVRGATQKPAFYTGSWTDGVTPIETKKIYWYRVISSAGSTFKYYILPDNEYMIDTLPGISAWTYQCEISTNIFSNSKFAIGYNSNASSEYWKGAISKVHITINDSSFFDSDTAVEGTDFVNNGCTITKDTVGPVYPSLSIGTLKTYQSWLYLKDIEALKIENQDSSAGTIKIEDAVNFEHVKSDLYTQKFDLHTKNKIAAGSTAIAYLDNPSDIYDNQYDVLVDRYNDDDESGKPALIYTEDGLAYWLISNSKFALYTQNVYGKLKPFYYDSNNEKVYLEENNINYRFKRKETNYDNVDDTEGSQAYKLFPEYIYTCIMPPIVKQPIECCFLNQNKDSIMNYSSERIVNYYSKYRDLSMTIVGDSKITLCVPANVHEYDIIVYNLSINFQYKDNSDNNIYDTSINRGYILDTKL
jgi:hypothetical protein